MAEQRSRQASSHNKHFAQEGQLWNTIVTQSQQSPCLLPRPCREEALASLSIEDAVINTEDFTRHQSANVTEVLLNPPSEELSISISGGAETPGKVGQICAALYLSRNISVGVGALSEPYINP